MELSKTSNNDPNCVFLKLLSIIPITDTDQQLTEIFLIKYDLF
jgi:hypothetical protein